MDIAYKILMGIEVFVALLLTAIIFVTGKGDAMSSGASGVRTTFRGKASFDDKVARVVVGLGCTFILLAIILDVMAKNSPDTPAIPTSSNQTSHAPSTPTPSAPTPAPNNSNQ